MKRKILLSLAGVLLALVVGVFCVDNSVYANMVSRKIRAQALQAGTQLTIDSPSLSWIGFNAQSMRGFPRGVPIIFDIQEVKTWIPLSSLASFSPKFFLTGKFLSGMLTGHAELKDKPSQLEINLKDAHVNEHPQLLGLGITSGLLSLLVTSQDGQTATVTLSLEELNKPSKTRLPQTLTNTPLPITVPPILNFNLDTITTLQQGQVTIESLTSRSSLGELTLKGTLSKPDPQQRPEINVSGRLVLTEQGTTHISPLLALLSGGQVTSEHKTVDFTARGRSSQPRWTFSGQ